MSAELTHMAFVLLPKEVKCDILSPTSTPVAPTPVVPSQEGRLEITYPLEMKVEEAETVTVEIMIDPKAVTRDGRRDGETG